MTLLARTLQELTFGRGYTAEYVAEFTGRDLSFVRRCLRGDKRPGSATLILWAQAVTSDREAYRQDKVGYPATLTRLVTASLADAAADLSRKVQS